MMPTTMLQLPPVRPWVQIRDEKVKEMTHHSAIELRRLEEKLQQITNRQRTVEAEIERTGTSEAALAVYRILQRWWFVFFVATVALIMSSVWWSLNWFGLVWWEKLGIVFAIVVLPLIGWTVFLKVARERAKRLWWLFGIISLAIIVLSAGATGLLAYSRMSATILEEERQSSVPSDDLAATPERAPTQSTARAKQVLTVTAVLIGIFLALAAEGGAGLAFDNYHHYKTAVRTVEPFYRERDALGTHLVENMRLQEEVKRWPELLYSRLTIEGLERDAAREEAERQAAIEAAEKKELEASRKREKEEARDQLSHLVIRVAIAAVIFSAVLFGTIYFAFADSLPTMTVVILDLSTSTPQEEFALNLRAVEGLIRRAGPKSRVVVLGISEASFSMSALFREAAPADPGLFKEHLEAWQRRAINKWRQASTTLKPTSRGSDLLGAISRAAVEFDDDAAGYVKSLIIFSDMRHVGQGFNFEKIIVPFEDVQKRGIAATLPGVRVWILGASTDGITSQQWNKLKTFWSIYFERAGATLITFSPNRRLREAQAP